MKNKLIQQKGLSIGSFIIFMAGAGLAAILATKCVPVWLENMAIKKTLKNIEMSGESSEINARKVFEKAIETIGIENIKGSDVTFTSGGIGLIANYDYEAKVHLIGNTSVLFNFKNQ